MSTTAADPTALLPPNATAQERAISRATERASTVPVPNRTLWNPWTCPADTLPWLAWSLDVKDWDTAWTEHQKRAAIAASVEVHRRAGTIGALRRALAAIGYEVTVNEATGQPYTFDLEVEVGDKGMGAETFNEAERIALRNKNARSHLRAVRAILRSNGRLTLAASASSGVNTAVLPYWRRTPQLAEALLVVAAAAHDIDTVTFLAPDANSTAWEWDAVISLGIAPHITANLNA
ncbi:phage tail protein I [Opitutaceae bacterium TAV4]|nr:phage tail protein I [Opitutaceae bacterium TAV4]RRK00795.1 phage tail protein I [Opitutaceae bacterium TAV3]